MRLLFRDIAFTLLLVCVLLVALEVAVGRTRSGLSYKDEFMCKNADRIKVLVLGNSLFANSIDPHELGDSVFDAATDARSLWYDRMILEKYAPEMSNLEVVLIPLIASLYAKPNPTPFFTYPYARYMDIPYGNNPMQYSALLSGRLTFRGLAPIRVLNQVVNSTDYHHDHFMDSIGYSPLFHFWNGYQRNVHIPRYEEALQSKEEFVRLVTEMADYCNSHGARLICVLPPASDVYIKDIDPRMYDTLESVMNRLSRTCLIEYKFYHNDPDFRADSLYADELHLNYWGAKQFAKKVKTDFSL